MKLLIVGNSYRKLHLEHLSHELKKLNIESKVIVDSDFIEKTLSFKFFKYFEKKKKLDLVIKQFKPDLVLIDRISKIGNFLIKKNIPFIILLRGNIWEELDWYKKLNQKCFFKKLRNRIHEDLIKKMFHNSLGIIVISEYLKNETSKRYPNKKIDLIYADGRNLSEWIPKKSFSFSQPCIGLIQGLNVWPKTKELETLGDVMKNLPYVNFYLAGDGEYSEKIIPKLIKYENFTWLGNLEYPKKIIEFLSSIDIFLFLSGLEGLGQSIIESMIMEKPIIATNVGGISELISDGKTGYLVNIGDSQKITHYIEYILSNEKIKNDLIINAKLKSKNFSWHKIAHDFSIVLEKYR